MSKKEEGNQESAKIEKLDRPLGIVEVWQEIEAGKARVLVPVIHKISKNWWEFPGGKPEIPDNQVKLITSATEAFSEIYEEIGLIIPPRAEEIVISGDPFQVF